MARAGCGRGRALHRSAARSARRGAPRACGDPYPLRVQPPADGAAFDRGYVDAQVSAHQYALQNLDRMIASGTLSPEVLGLMRTMRAAVASHLQMATQLRGSL